MTTYTLADLGWSASFARQTAALDPDQSLTPARITELHRDRLMVLTEAGPARLIPTDLAASYAVGDWVLSDGTHAQHRLEPATDLARRAAGETVARQRIAANMDSIAIVTSCNADFNLARIERYLSLILSSGAIPLVVLTRADETDDTRPYLRKSEQLSPLVIALAVDARDAEDARRLEPWCKSGQTLALVGSSGVGKTTLRNALCGDAAETAGIREDDARGRHTTTFRAMRPTLAGGWLIDTPGMRELQLTGAEDGIAQLFGDFEEIAQACRFRDCAHDTEPGCAIRAAVAAGTLAQDRLERWQKLRREDARNSETLSEARGRARRFGKVVKEAQRVRLRKEMPGD